MLAEQKRRLFSEKYPRGAIREHKSSNYSWVGKTKGTEKHKGFGHAAVRSLRSAEPLMPRDEQKRMKMSPLFSTVPVTATSKPSP